MTVQPNTTQFKLAYVSKLTPSRKTCKSVTVIRGKNLQGHITVFSMLCMFDDV